MAGYTLNDAWCSVEDVRNQNPLITSAVVADDGVNGFIDDAVELIKSKLRNRYDLTKFILPLPADLKQIRLLTARLASYKMASTRPDIVSNPDILKLHWGIATKELDELGSGAISLPKTYLLSEPFTHPGTIRGALTPLKRTKTIERTAMDVE